MRICTRCVLDETVPAITFNNSGECEYCELHDQLDAQNPVGEQGQDWIRSMVREMRRSSRGSPYDCVIGVSGGTDSSYALHVACSSGLRPLAVHVDNGWNTETAVRNMDKVTHALGVNLRVVPADSAEFYDLQLAFLKASIPSVELPTDMALRGYLYRAALDVGVRHVILGTSFRTEGITPHQWGYCDGRLIRSVHRRHGTSGLRGYPNLTLSWLVYFRILKQLQDVRILNHIDYTKEAARELLSREYRWVDYGGWHHESTYTKFLVSYLAPRKFGIDRRKVIWSANIRRGYLERDVALGWLRAEPLPPYPEEEATRDIEVISRKLGVTTDELARYIDAPPRRILDYSTYYTLIRALGPIWRAARRLGVAPALFQGDKLPVLK